MFLGNFRWVSWNFCRGIYLKSSTQPLLCPTVGTPIDGTSVTIGRNFRQALLPTVPLLHMLRFLSLSSAQTLEGDLVAIEDSTTKSLQVGMILAHHPWNLRELRRFLCHSSWYDPLGPKTCGCKMLEELSQCRRGQQQSCSTEWQRGGALPSCRACGTGGRGHGHGDAPPVVVRGLRVHEPVYPTRYMYHDYLKDSAALHIARLEDPQIVQP